MGRDIYAEEAIRYIPRILGLVDRNPLSPTYGCFDKSYWHYKTMDFPSAMYEECVLPLALVYKYKFPGGDVYYQKERIKELVIAGIYFADKSSHRDGSCDDYYPFERALGAAAFSLYACTESALLLGIRDERVLSFLKRRGGWLLNHDEAGRLSNHQALSALSLYNVYLLTGEGRFLEGARKRVKRTLEWQSDEGWFQEYEGCDLGYHTLTVDFLAKYYIKSKDATVLEPLKRGVEFASYFIHPDGSYGGEYGSRNTFNFFPHGFELMGRILPLATQITDRFLEGIKNGKRAYFEDERIFFHTATNFLQAYIDYNNDRSRSPGERGDFVKYFDKAGIYVRGRKSTYTVISLAKGGVIKVFCDESHVYSDNGLIARLRNSEIIVTQQIDKYEVEIEEGIVRVGGRFGFCKPNVATPLKLILFRLGLLTLGRFSSNLVRRILQKMLITGKKKAPVAFKRTFIFDDKLKIIDEIKYLFPLGKRELHIEKLFAGTDHTSIYVATSNSYQESVLKPWVDYSAYIDELEKHGHTRIERVIEPIE